MQLNQPLYLFSLRCYFDHRQLEEVLLLIRFCEQKKYYSWNSCHVTMIKYEVEKSIIVLIYLWLRSVTSSDEESSDCLILMSNFCYHSLWRATDLLGIQKIANNCYQSYFDSIRCTFNTYFLGDRQSLLQNSIQFVFRNQGQNLDGRYFTMGNRIFSVFVNADSEYRTYLAQTSSFYY